MLERNATLACMATRTFDGPFWRLVLEAEGDVLTGIRWAARGERPRIQGKRTLLNDPARQLERYFAGRLKRFDLKIQPSGSPYPIVIVTPCHRALAGGGAALVDPPGLHGHDDDDDGREVNDEGVEGEADERADQNVGRIPDQGRGAAYVRGEYFREEERVGRDLELLADVQRHRHDLDAIHIAVSEPKQENLTAALDAAIGTHFEDLMPTPSGGPTPTPGAGS